MLRVGILLLLVCCTARAAEWVSIGKTTDGKIEQFVDSPNIQFAGEIRRVWAKSIFAPHWQRGQGGDADKWMTYFESFMAFNCGAHTVRLEANTYYYDDGTLSSTPASALPTSWQPVPPDSMLDKEMQVVCGATPK